MEVKTQENCLNRNKGHLGGLFGALFAVVAIFFIVPIFEKNFYTHLLLHSSFILLILSTVFMIEGKRTVLMMGFLFLIPFLYFDSLSFYYHSLPFMIIAYGFSLVFTLFAIIVLMRKILRAYLVDTDLIFGALMVYLLSGILWANFYFIENIVSPEVSKGLEL